MSNIYVWREVCRERTGGSVILITRGLRWISGKHSSIAGFLFFRQPSVYCGVIIGF